jgi:hypothetical protein
MNEVIMLFLSLHHRVRGDGGQNKQQGNFTEFIFPWKKVGK